MTEQLARLADTITALTEPYMTAETYMIGKTQRVHRVRHPSLLDQLAAAIEPSTAGEYANRAVQTSKPAARIDAIDRLLAIRSDVAHWLRFAGLPVGDDVAVSMRKLVGVPWDDDDLAELVATARRWLAWAKVTTGWDTPPFRPHVRCPACDWRGSLRIRLAEQVATCVECGAAWDAGTIGVLAEYIRTAA